MLVFLVLWSFVGAPLALLVGRSIRHELLGDQDQATTNLGMSGQPGECLGF